MIAMYVLLTLGGALALVAAAAFLRLAVAFVRRRRPPRRNLWIAAGVTGAALSLVCIELSTDFGPEPATDAHSQFEEVPGFEGFGGFDELDQPTD